MHTLGFFHEHSRYDRDNYVTVNWNNIQPCEVLFFSECNIVYPETFLFPIITVSQSDDLFYSYKDVKCFPI